MYLAGSAMATSIAAMCTGAGSAVAMGTSLTWLAFSTVAVGLAIIAVGKKKLATLVRYSLPGGAQSFGCQQQ